jgi:anti-sigma factor ChrR (cupin superfamily)
MENLVNIFENLGWEKARDYPAGTLRKILRDGKGGRTVLLKLPAKFKMGPHSHVVTEQHLVLKGSYTSEGRAYSEGSYQIFSPNEGHGPFESQEGALILVIWDSMEES